MSARADIYPFLLRAVNAQLEAIVEALAAAAQRVDTLARRLSPIEWSTRPAPGRWSPIECVAHLNLTAEAFLPLLHDGIERARGLRRRPPLRYRRDLRGWLIWHVLKTPGKFRTKTPAAFVPTAGRPPSQTLEAFVRLQGDQTACVQASDGLPVDRVMMVSPFDRRLKYSVYSALTILPAHQHRHLWQAEEAEEANAKAER
jgi:DinB family protein